MPFKSIAYLSLAVLATVSSPDSYAQAYPSKPVRVIVPYPAGSGLDTLARSLAQKLGPRWNETVIVENKPGSSTIAGAVAVKNAPADGYTLLLTSDATISTNPHLYSKLPYEPAKDFVPITELIVLNQLLLANIDVPANTLAEVISYAKKNPGKLNYASYGNGSQPHLAMETLKNQADINIVHVPYKGIPQAVPAAIAGEVQFTFSGAASSLAHIKAKRLKAIAIGGEQRLGLVPDVPTFAELGYPDVPAGAWFGLFAPAGTPKDIVEKLYRDVTSVLKEADFHQSQVEAKGYTPVLSSPAEFAAFLVGDSKRMAKAVKVSGATVE